MVLSLASALPEPLVNIYNLFIEKKIKAARDAQLNLIKFTNSLPKSIKNDNFLGGAEEKFILSLRGVCKHYMTDYYREVNESEKKTIKVALKDSGFINYI